MKTHTFVPIPIFVIALGLPVDVPAASGSPSTPAPVSLDAGPHHRVWQSVTSGTDAQGQSIAATNRWTELSTGLNYMDRATGQWTPSIEAFEITPQGYAVARRGQHKLILAPNINEGGSVDLELPDGERLRSNRWH